MLWFRINSKNKEYGLYELTSREINELQNYLKENDEEFEFLEWEDYEDLFKLKGNEKLTEIKDFIDMFQDLSYNDQEKFALLLKLDPVKFTDYQLIIEQMKKTYLFDSDYDGENKDWVKAMDYLCEKFGVVEERTWEIIDREKMTDISKDRGYITEAPFPSRYDYMLKIE